MRQFGFCAISLLLFFTAGCASQQGTLTDTSTTETAVPGEKVSDEGRVVPGAGPGSNASVHW
ncbi:MAG TPA: hypothetical protein DCG89_09570 [Spartobacteria bacterium]|nr:hypothetical protein [Spartobacteria bacterium]